MAEVKRADIKERPENWDDIVESYHKSVERAESQLKESRGQDALTTDAALKRIRVTQSHTIAEEEPVDKSSVIREPQDPLVIAEREKTKSFVQQKLTQPTSTTKPETLEGRVTRKDGTRKDFEQK